jgi:hypothetical protein
MLSKATDRKFEPVHASYSNVYEKYMCSSAAMFLKPYIDAGQMMWDYTNG